MVASREPRATLGLGVYERLIESIDWNRVVLQAEGLHDQLGHRFRDIVCGECIKSVLLRTEE